MGSVARKRRHSTMMAAQCGPCADRADRERQRQRQREAEEARQKVQDNRAFHQYLSRSPKATTNVEEAGDAAEASSAPQYEIGEMTREHCRAWLGTHRARVLQLLLEMDPREWLKITELKPFALGHEDIDETELRTFILVWVKEA